MFRGRYSDFHKCYQSGFIGNPRLPSLFPALPDSAVQRSQECGKSGLFLAREIEGLDPRIEVGIPSSAIGVKLDNIIERRQAAIVHVRRGPRDFAERWGFEGAAVTLEGKATAR